MIRRLAIRPQARLEILKGASWYEKRREGLGSEFRRAVESCISSIVRNPFLYPQVHGEIRRAALRRFPYGILYKVNEDLILVIGCMHSRRDSEKWKDRS